MGPSRTLHIFVLSWPGYESQALRIEKNLCKVFPHVHVIHSLTGASEFSVPAHWIVLPDGYYYGRKFEESLKIAHEGHMLHIQADADSDDWEGLVRSCEDAFFSDPRLGLWSPMVDYTPWSLRRTVLEKLAQPGLNRVSMVDGIVWAISETVLTRLRQFSFDMNPLGRGIEVAAAAVSRDLGLNVIVDSSINVRHPRGSGYSEAEAARQLQEFLKQLSTSEQVGRKWIEDLQIMRIANEKRASKRVCSRIKMKLLDPIYKLHLRVTKASPNRE